MWLSATSSAASLFAGWGSGLKRIAAIFLICCCSHTATDKKVKYAREKSIQIIEFQSSNACGRLSHDNKIIADLMKLEIR